MITIIIAYGKSQRDKVMKTKSTHNIWIDWNSILDHDKESIIKMAYQMIEGRKEEKHYYVEYKPESRDDITDILRKIDMRVRNLADNIIVMG